MDINYLKYDYYKIKTFIRDKTRKRDNQVVRYFHNKYAGKSMMTPDEINEYISKLILSKMPFCVGRIGATEQFCFNCFEFKRLKNQKKAIEQLCHWSGFFPEEVEKGIDFSQLMRQSYKDIDVLGVWNLPAEDYCINKYMSEDIRLTYITSLQPWRSINAWSKALKGKTVLVIHPFEQSIQQQYCNNRKQIFSGTDILPEFQLKTLKAVQTIAGVKDLRFNTWFDALDYQTTEIERIEFDIAILGCGAYGLPLACRIKNMGKQAIHLGGVTQLLFGIMGERWVEEPCINQFVNQYWIRPSLNEQVPNTDIVEGSCYW